MQSTERVFDSAYYDHYGSLLEGIQRRVTFFQIEEAAIEDIKAEVSRQRLLTAWQVIVNTQDSEGTIGQEGINNLSPPAEFTRFYHKLEDLALRKEFPDSLDRCFKLLEEAAYAAELEGSWIYYHQMKNSEALNQSGFSQLLEKVSANPFRIWGISETGEGADFKSHLAKNQALAFIFLFLNFHARCGNKWAGLLKVEPLLVKQNFSGGAFVSAIEELKTELRSAYRQQIEWSEFNPIQRNLHNWYFDYGFALSSKTAPQWNERQLSIIRMMFQQRTITTRELYGRFSCNRKTIQRDFKELMDSNMVVQERQGSALRYALNLRRPEEMESEGYNITLPEAPEVVIVQPSETEKRKLRYGKRLAAKAALNMLQLSFDYSSSSLNR